MFNFVNQSIMDQFEVLSRVGERNKKGDKVAPPIVDASDMQALLICLPFILDRLAEEALEEYKEEGNGQVRLYASV